MELRYCEKCFKVLKLEDGSEEINPAEHFLCSRCKASGAAAGPGKGKVKPQGILDFLSSPLEERSLDLFTSATVALHKERRRKKKESSGLLGLRIEGEPPPESFRENSKGSSAPAKTANKIQFRCLRCRTLLQIRPVKGPSRAVCPRCKLNLFVDESGLISLTPPDATKPSTQEKAAGDRPARSPSFRKGLRRSAHPEPVRLQFHCLHCRVVLRVLPVQELSRIICPKCKGNLFIDPAGLVSKIPPRISEEVKPCNRSRASGKERSPALPPVERGVPPAEGEEKKAARPPRPKRAWKRKRKARASPAVEHLVRVSTFLPPDVVEKIEKAGKSKSKVIREIIEEKVGSPAPRDDARGSQ